MDLTPQYWTLCKQHRPDLPLNSYVFRVETLNGFLKEAYRIVSTRSSGLRPVTTNADPRMHASQS